MQRITSLLNEGIRQLERSRAKSKLNNDVVHRQDNKENEWVHNKDISRRISVNNIQMLKQEVSRDISAHRQISKSVAEYIQVRPTPAKRSAEELEKENQRLAAQLQQYKNLVLKLQSEFTSKQKKLLIELEQLKNELTRVPTFLNKSLKSNVSFLDETQQPTYRTQTHSPVLQQLMLIFNGQYLSKMCQPQLKSTKQLSYTLQALIARSLRLESFAKSLFDMKKKIQNQKQHDRDLKQCWRWLKQVIEDYIRLKHCK